MSWGSWSDFFAMGGYALYVWGSYAVTFAVMAAEVMLLFSRRRSIVEQLGHLDPAQDRARRVKEGAA